MSSTRIDIGGFNETVCPALMESCLASTARMFEEQFEKERVKEAPRLPVLVRLTLRKPWLAPASNPPQVAPEKTQTSEPKIRPGEELTTKLMLSAEALITTRLLLWLAIMRAKDRGPPLKDLIDAVRLPSNLLARYKGTFP